MIGVLADWGMGVRIPSKRHKNGQFSHKLLYCYSEMSTSLNNYPFLIFSPSPFPFKCMTINQCCGSAFVSMRIRIQQSSSIRIRIRDLMTNIVKLQSWKKSYFSQKITLNLSLGLHEKPPALKKRTSSTVGHFCPLGSGSSRSKWGG